MLRRRERLTRVEDLFVRDLVARRSERHVSDKGDESVDAAFNDQREERKGEVLATVRLLVHVLLRVAVGATCVAGRRLRGLWAVGAAGQRSLPCGKRA